MYLFIIKSLRSEWSDVKHALLERFTDGGDRKSDDNYSTNIIFLFIMVKL